MNRMTLTIGLGTLLIFGIGGIVLIEWVDNRSFTDIVTSGQIIALQLSIGSAFGVIAALGALFIITRPFFKKQKQFYYTAIASKLSLNYGVIIFLSLCAGIGEEIFFRAGLQPIFGIWITSLVFVALHGYLSITNWRLALYGCYMFLAVVGFGVLFQYSGLWSVILAHAVFDFILFLHIRRTRNSEISDNSVDYDDTGIME